MMDLWMSIGALTVLLIAVFIWARKLKIELQDRRAKDSIYIVAESVEKILELLLLLDGKDKKLYKKIGYWTAQKDRFIEKLLLDVPIERANEMLMAITIDEDVKLLKSKELDDLVAKLKEIFRQLQKLSTVWEKQYCTECDDNMQEFQIWRDDIVEYIRVVRVQVLEKEKALRITDTAGKSNLPKKPAIVAISSNTDSNQEAQA